MGVIYVLTNPMMPRIVKIGLTIRSHVYARLQEFTAQAYRYHSLVNMRGSFLPINVSNWNTHCTLHLIRTA